MACHDEVFVRDVLWWPPPFFTSRRWIVHWSRVSSVLMEAPLPWGQNFWGLGFAETQKFPSLWGSPLFFCAPKTVSASKMEIGTLKKGLATSNLQFLSRSAQKSLLPPSLSKRLKCSWVCVPEKRGTQTRGTSGFHLIQRIPAACLEVVMRCV